MDHPPNKRRRLAPKMPDPVPPPLPPIFPARSSSEQSQAPLQHASHSANPSPPPAADAVAVAPPPAFYPERQDFESFAKHLQEAAMYIYRQGQRPPYTNVSALLLKWDDDVISSAEVSSLERVFHDRFNFHTERWGIPAVANPSAKLNARIADFLNQAGADHLLIIYYIGNAFVGSDNQMYWACNVRDDSPKLKWDAVRYLFDDAESDILVLLDSCTSKDMPVAGSNGAKQMIAAYAPDGIPHEPGCRTFTSYLVEALLTLGGGRPFNVQRLYDEILACQHHHEHNHITRTAVSPLPLFLPLTTGKSPSTIYLAPIARNPSNFPLPQHSPQNGASHRHPDGKSHNGLLHDGPVISPAAVSNMVFEEARVLVCTTFVGDTSPDITAIKQWVASTPSLTSRIAVEGMFLGPPTVLLISIPQSLWNIIENEKICFSLGYINSRNLIPLYDSLMEATAARPASLSPARNPYLASLEDVEDGRTLLAARQAAVSNIHANSQAASHASNSTNTNHSNHTSDHPHSSYYPLHHQDHQDHQDQQQQHHQHHQQEQQQQHQEQQPQHPHHLEQHHPHPHLPSRQASLPLPPLPPLANGGPHHLPPPPYHDINASRYQSNLPRPDMPLPDSVFHQQQQQQQQQRYTSPPTHLPRIVSRAGSPIPKEESEDSAEMKEAAEQLKALSHIRPESGDTSPPSQQILNNNHLSKLAQDVFKCQADTSEAEESDAVNVDGNATPQSTRKSKARKDIRFRVSKSNDGQSPSQSRSRADRSSQALASLQQQQGSSQGDTVCPTCHIESFKDASSLRKHIAAVHTRPFPCAFAFAGCGSTFGSKNEWKRHIASQHLCLQFYRCSGCSQSTTEGKGNEFNRKDLFTQHLRRMHAPVYIRKAVQKREGKVESEWDDYVKDMQKSCCFTRRRPPQRAACPKPGCVRPFEGRNAWDDWTEHVGRHMENGEGEQLGVDELLISWSLDEGIIVQTENGGYRLCNSVGNTGGNAGSIIGGRRSHAMLPEGTGAGKVSGSLSNANIPSLASVSNLSNLSNASNMSSTSAATYSQTAGTEDHEPVEQRNGKPATPSTPSAPARKPLPTSTGRSSNGGSWHGEHDREYKRENGHATKRKDLESSVTPKAKRIDTREERDRKDTKDANVHKVDKHEKMDKVDKIEKVIEVISNGKDGKSPDMDGERSTTFKDIKETVEKPPSPITPTTPTTLAPLAEPTKPAEPAIQEAQEVQFQLKMDPEIGKTNDREHAKPADEKALEVTKPEVVVKSLDAVHTDDDGSKSITVAAAVTASAATAVVEKDEKECNPMEVDG